MLKLANDVTPEFSAILSEDCLTFLSALHDNFAERISRLLHERTANAAAIRQGKKSLDFLAETAAIRNDESWKIAGIPEELRDRRVEITGPAERKMIINGVNSGAKVYMACFEDALTPTLHNILDGQLSLYELTRDALTYSSGAKNYRPNDTYPSEKLATVIVRPRGLHLEEKHFLINGMPTVGALIDFGLYFFNNAQALIAKKSAPYFYIPKLESHKESACWNDIFKFSENYLDIMEGAIKATVLIETIDAAFQMDEILHSMKNYIVGLNAGRWDYIFSYIKRHAHLPANIMPNRHQITMTQPFMESYARLLIKTCHRRGAFAMGGMAAFIPVKDDEQANSNALEMVHRDKTREAREGHDGTWVAHPALIETALSAFDSILQGSKNQVSKKLDIEVQAKDLLAVPAGEITEDGIRNNISVCIIYMANWLTGKGCVPIYNLMEDAATAEIARTQLWQWVHYEAAIGKVPPDGNEREKITQARFLQFLEEELARLPTELPHALPIEKAADLLKNLVLQDTLKEFLTLDTYREIA